MPHRCVVFGCSNVTSRNEGISLHIIPFANDDRAEAKKRRKKWIDFVRRRRLNFEPSATSKICSRHFKAEDFVRRFGVHLTGDEAKLKAVLKSDEFGICVYPTISLPDCEETKPLSARDRRHSVSIVFSCYLFTIVNRLTFHITSIYSLKIE